MLEQKVAVVTGASRGIGRAIAEKLAEEGVFVVINYRGNEEQAKQVQQTIKEQGGNAGTKSALFPASQKALFKNRFPRHEQQFKSGSAHICTDRTE